MWDTKLKGKWFDGCRIHNSQNRIKCKQQNMSFTIWVYSTYIRLRLATMKPGNKSSCRYQIATPDSKDYKHGWNIQRTKSARGSNLLKFIAEELQSVLITTGPPRTCALVTKAYFDSTFSDKKIKETTNNNNRN